MANINVTRITDNDTREKAFTVIDEVYYHEKNWIKSTAMEIPENINDIDKVSWFLAEINGEPAGVIRLVYDPSLEFPEHFKVTLNKNIDVENLVKKAKLVDIGRFMIRPKFRRNIRIAIRLMRSAIKEVIERGYTHFITDVFENEPNSPYEFHTRILGFEVIGTHLHGELNCSCTRIILTLDILGSYAKIRNRKNAFFNEVTKGIRYLLDSKLEAYTGKKN